MTVAALWMALSIFLSQPWWHDLSAEIGTVAATSLIALIAIIPGFMNAFVVTALLLDERPPRKMPDQYPAVTVLIPAYNEQDSIRETVQSVLDQDYRGRNPTSHCGRAIPGSVCRFDSGTKSPGPLALPNRFGLQAERWRQRCFVCLSLRHAGIGDSILGLSDLIGRAATVSTSSLGLVHRIVRLFDQLTQKCLVTGLR